MPHVTIVKGDQHAQLEDAVETWTTKPSCRVFLLHAGAAAAGLTLIAAQHVSRPRASSVPPQPAVPLAPPARSPLLGRPCPPPSYPPPPAHSRIRALPHARARSS